MRTRKLGKVKFYNSVRWCKLMGMDRNQIKTFLYTREYKKLDSRGVRGKKRQSRIKRRKTDVRKALATL